MFRCAPFVSARALITRLLVAVAMLRPDFFVLRGLPAVQFALDCSTHCRMIRLQIDSRASKSALYKRKPHKCGVRFGPVKLEAVLNRLDVTPD